MTLRAAIEEVSFCADVDGCGCCATEYLDVVEASKVPGLVAEELRRMSRYISQEANLQDNPKTYRAMLTAAQVLDSRASSVLLEKA